MYEHTFPVTNSSHRCNTTTYSNFQGQMSSPGNFFPMQSTKKPCLAETSNSPLQLRALCPDTVLTQTPRACFLCDTNILLLAFYRQNDTNCLTHVRFCAAEEKVSAESCQRLQGSHPARTRWPNSTYTWIRVSACVATMEFLCITHCCTCILMLR